MTAKRFMAAMLLAAMLLAAVSAAAVLPIAAHAEENTEVSLHFAQMVNWADGGDGEELKVCDLYFSNDVLMKENGASIDYRINDGSKYAGEDFSYIQEYIYLNGKSMAEINANTDTSEYVFQTFPSTTTGSDAQYYAVPIVIYSNSPDHLQIRVHKKYLEDVNAGDEITFQFKQGLSADAQMPNETASAYIPVTYVLADTTTFTKDAEGSWSCDRELKPYEAPEEVIDRADIDFSKIEYSDLYLSSVSDIIEYGTGVPVGGQVRKPQYLCVYFDRAISYQYIPYASMGKRDLSNLAQSAGSGVSLTQTQIDAIFDYRIDLSLNDHVKIDGKTLRECKKSEMTSADTKIYICLERDYFTLYLSADSANWLDPSQPHTIEITEGFRTPLFGELETSVTFYFDPEKRVWSETDYASLEDPAYDWTEQQQETSGCNGSIGISSAMIALPVVFAASLAMKRRGAKK